jgi:hypothetical protein
VITKAGEALSLGFISGYNSQFDVAGQVIDCWRRMWIMRVVTWSVFGEGGESLKNVCVIYFWPFFSEKSLGWVFYYVFMLWYTDSHFFWKIKHCNILVKSSKGSHGGFRTGFRLATYDPNSMMTVEPGMFGLYLISLCFQLDAQDLGSQGLVDKAS